MNSPITLTSPLQGNSRASDKFVVRLPDGFRERVAEHATASGNSMNTFIIRTLTEKVNALEGLSVCSEYVEGMLCRFNEKPYVIEKFHISDQDRVVVYLSRNGVSENSVYIEDIRPY